LREQTASAHDVHAPPAREQAEHGLQHADVRLHPQTITVERSARSSAGAKEGSPQQSKVSFSTAVAAGSAARHSGTVGRGPSGTAR